MKKNSIFNNIIWIIFMAFGLIFFAVSIFIHNFSFIPKEDRVEVTATIIDIIDNGEERAVLISYVVDDVTYERYLNSYSSSYYEGKEITIYYDKNNPIEVVDDTSLTLTYVFGGIGIVFMTISAIFIIIKKAREKMIIRLRETGNIINAKYLSTQVNKNYTVNNRHPYNIVCEWDNSMDGKKYIFRSENIWIDPEHIIRDKNIKTFRVYFNPNNLKQYYVDVEVLLDNIVDLR